MTLSVLMAVYKDDSALFFNEALMSIWDLQSRRPDQIVIVEDGQLSLDLYSVLDHWSKKLDKILIRVPQIHNKGLTKSLNIGIIYCVSDYIARMDADDLSDPMRFERQLNFLNSNLNIIALGGAIQEFNSENDNICIRRYPLDQFHIKKFISKASPLAHGSVIFRRKIFDEGIRYNEKYKTSQDLDLWFQLLDLDYQIANLSEIVYKVRVSDDFFNRRSKNKAMNEFEIYWRGIIKLYGVSIKLVYPLARIVFRFIPINIIKIIYSGRLRKIVLQV